MSGVNGPELIAGDGVALEMQSGGQTWIVTWHPPPDPPSGQRHGAMGICITAADEVVLISEDGETWDLPAGRPEGAETWEATLRREMLEEACATVAGARLLGFVRGECVDGHEEGLILVRSIWRADVHLAPWDPQFEIAHRRVVAPSEVLAGLHVPPAARAIAARALREAGLSI